MLLPPLKWARISYFLGKRAACLSSVKLAVAVLVFLYIPRLRAGVVVGILRGPNLPESLCDHDKTFYILHFLISLKRRLL
jgi:hypothetical protein